jgi:hypothetical protein
LFQFNNYDKIHQKNRNILFSKFIQIKSEEVQQIFSKIFLIIRNRNKIKNFKSRINNNADKRRLEFQNILDNEYDLSNSIINSETSSINDELERSLSPN